MSLLIRLREPSSIPLEVDSVRLETVRAQSPDEVRATLIQRGNRQVQLGEFFDVSGSAAEDLHVVWEGDCAKVKLIGTHLTTGRITVEGNAGMHVGAEMRGGEVVVTGNALDWAGAEMKGGRLRILGNAGHLVGAAYRGGRRGMTGGMILVHGNVGNEVGVTMRRGLIAVGGNAGDAVGFNMIAGSVLIGGDAGIRHGAGMRRGTISLLGRGPVEMLPTFKYACTYHPVFMRCYFRELLSLGFPLPEDCLDIPLRRFCGDIIEMGKGEILTR